MTELCLLQLSRGALQVSVNTKTRKYFFKSHNFEYSLSNPSFKSQAWLYFAGKFIWRSVPQQWVTAKVHLNIQVFFNWELCEGMSSRSLCRSISIGLRHLYYLYILGETFFICCITLNQVKFFRSAIQKRHGGINHYVLEFFQTWVTFTSDRFFFG